MIACRREIHGYGETGFNTKKTLAFISSELQKMGIESQSCGKAGLVALICKSEGECFLLRADIDALPIKEETALPFAAQKGGFHGCGHDVHAAMLLGAARVLKNHEKELSHSVKLMFQSAEEILAGAKDMVENGVLHAPEVGGAMMLHVMTAVPMEAGSIVVASEGISAPAADYFRIKIAGRGCHGSSPHLGIDPVSAAAHIICALEHIHARELAMGEKAALTVGAIKGAESANVIPDSLTLEGTMRAFSEATREKIKRRIGEIASGVASALGAKAETEFYQGCPALRNDGKMVKMTLEKARELLGEEKVFSAGDLPAGRVSGSEDFAYVAEKVPSVMVALAAGEEKKGYKYGLHHPKADFDEKAMTNGAALLACCAMAWRK